MLAGAYVVIVLLTWALVVMNVRYVVVQFTKDHNFVKLYSYLITLLVMGSIVIGVASAVIQRAMDVEILLKSDATGPVRYSRR